METDETQQMQTPQPDFSLEDAVDAQLEAIDRSLKEKGFKPTEGLTQGYVESQRIFAKVAVAILSFVAAIQLEEEGDTVSTDDNLMRVYKMLEAFSQPWRASSIAGQVAEVERLVANSKVRNGLYSLAYEGHVGKSLVWCVASLVRVLYVVDLYGMRTPPFNNVAEFIEVGKAAVEEDFEAMRFNYGTYARDSRRQPRFRRPIRDADRDAAGLNGPMDAFVGVKNERRRPDALQEVVDLISATQDTLSVIAPLGKFSNENVSVSVISAYDASEGAHTQGGEEEGRPQDGSPWKAVLSSLANATANITPACEYKHNSPYEKEKVFLNVPRNIRGPAIFQTGRRVNGKYLSEIVTRMTDAAYTEDVAAAAVGLSFLALDNDCYISMGTGANLEESVDSNGIIRPMEVHVDELVFLTIAKDDEGRAANRTADNGEPLLEDVVTNNLLNCSLRVSLGLPDDGAGNILPFESVAFYVALFPPSFPDRELIVDFFKKVVIFSLTATDAIAHIADDSIIVTLTDYRIPLSLFHGHIADEGLPTAMVNSDTQPLPVIGNSLQLPNGSRMAQEAYRNVAVNFTRNISKFGKF